MRGPNRPTQKSIFQELLKATVSFGIDYINQDVECISMSGKFEIFYLKLKLKVTWF